MKLTDEQIRLMQDELSIELIQLLMEEWHYSQQEAMSVLYNSDTFDRLSNSASGLYYQSPGYVYSILEHELKTGSIA